MKKPGLFRFSVELAWPMYLVEPDRVDKPEKPDGQNKPVKRIRIVGPYTQKGSYSRET